MPQHKPDELTLEERVRWLETRVQTLENRANRSVSLQKFSLQKIRDHWASLKGEKK